MPTAGFQRRRVDAKRVASAARASLQAEPVDRYKVGQVHEIALRRLRSNPENARAWYSARKLDEMKASLKAQGQLMAATAFVDKDGDVVLIEGERRKRAAEALGWETLRIEIRPEPASRQLLYLASRASNMERAEQSPLDDAFSWRRLLDRKVFASQAALARAVQASESEVSRTLALAELPARLAQSLSETPELLNLKMLNALREYFERKGEDETLALAVDVVKKGLSYREVEARRKALEAGPQQRPRSDRQELNYHGVAGVIRSFSNGGRVEVSLKGLEPEQAEEVVNLLKELLHRPTHAGPPKVRPPARGAARSAASAASPQGRP